VDGTQVGTQLRRFFQWLAQVFRSDEGKYIALLEGDRARLLEENRQLVNSLLAGYGLQPIHAAGVERKPMKQPQGYKPPSVVLRGREQSVRDAMREENTGGQA